MKTMIKDILVIFNVYILYLLYSVAPIDVHKFIGGLNRRRTRIHVIYIYISEYFQLLHFVYLLCVAHTSYYYYIEELLFISYLTAIVNIGSWIWIIQKKRNPPFFMEIDSYCQFKYDYLILGTWWATKCDCLQNICKYSLSLSYRGCSALSFRMTYVSFVRFFFHCVYLCVYLCYIHHPSAPNYFPITFKFADDPLHSKHHSPATKDNYSFSLSVFQLRFQRQRISWIFSIWEIKISRETV